MKLSRKTEYALIAIKHMALKGFNEMTTAKEISDSYNIPYELLAKILQSLTKVQIISSVQGVKGGYKFTRCADDITISDIILSLDESYKITNCLKPENERKHCEISNCCNIKSPISIVQQKLDDLFTTTTIRHLL